MILYNLAATKAILRLLAFLKYAWNQHSVLDTECSVKCQLVVWTTLRFKRLTRNALLCFSSRYIYIMCLCVLFCYMLVFSPTQIWAAWGCESSTWRPGLGCDCSETNALKLAVKSQKLARCRQHLPHLPHMWFTGNRCLWFYMPFWRSLGWLHSVKAEVDNGTTPEALHDAFMMPWSWFQHVSACFSMFQHVSACFRMFQDGLMMFWRLMQRFEATFWRQPIVTPWRSWASPSLVRHRPVRPDAA